MWLLLLAAGTGYIARCWQKSCKPKVEARRCRHHARIYSAQRSPSCTPKRGRSTISGRHSRRRSSHSAKSASRHVLYGKREEGVNIQRMFDSGESQEGQAKTTDDTGIGEDVITSQLIDSAESGQSFCGDEGTAKQFLPFSRFSIRKRSFGTKNCRSNECIQDWWKELSLLNIKPLSLSSTSEGRGAPNSAVTDSTWSQALLEEKMPNIVSDGVLANNKLLEVRLQAFPGQIPGRVCYGPTAGCQENPNIRPEKHTCLKLAKSSSQEPFHVESNLLITDSKQSVYDCREFGGKTSAGENHDLILSSVETKDNLFMHSDVEGVTDLFAESCCSSMPERNPCKGLVGWFRGTWNCHKKMNYTCEQKKNSFQKFTQSKDFINLSHSMRKGSIRRRIFYRNTFKIIPCLGNCSKLSHSKMFPSPYMVHPSLANALLDPECFNLHSYIDDESHQMNKSYSINWSASKGLGHCDADFTEFCSTPLESGLDGVYCTSACKDEDEMAAEPSAFCSKTKRKCLCSREGTVSAFGLGVGVMLMLAYNQNELGNFRSLLRETETLIHDFKKQVKSAEMVMQNSSKESFDDKMMLLNPKAPDETCQSHQMEELSSVISKSPLELFGLANEKSESIITMDHTNGMADLEAELEAELRRMELSMNSTAPFDREKEKISAEELDLEESADIHNEAHLDLQFLAESDSDHYLDDDDDDIHIDLHDTAGDQVVDDELYECNYPVSPRDLERRLWPVLEQRQREQISELENVLQSTSTKLLSKEREIQWWKDRVLWLMEASLGDNSGSQRPRISMVGRTTVDAKV